MHLKRGCRALLQMKTGLSVLVHMLWHLALETSVSLWSPPQNPYFMTVRSTPSSSSSTLMILVQHVLVAGPIMLVPVELSMVGRVHVQVLMCVGGPTWHASQTPLPLGTAHERRHRIK